MDIFAVFKHYSRLALWPTVLLETTMSRQTLFKIPLYCTPRRETGFRLP